MSNSYRIFTKKIILRKVDRLDPKLKIYVKKNKYLNDFTGVLVQKENKNLKYILKLAAISFIN